MTDIKKTGRLADRHKERKEVWQIGIKRRKDVWQTGIKRVRKSGGQA